MFLDFLICVRHNSQWLTMIISFNLHNPIRRLLLLFLLYGCVFWDTDWLSNLPKVSQLVSGRAGIPTRVEWYQRPCLKTRVNLLCLYKPSTGHAMGTKEGVCWPWQVYWGGLCLISPISSSAVLLTSPPSRAGAVWGRRPLPAQSRALPLHSLGPRGSPVEMPPSSGWFTGLPAQYPAGQPEVPTSQKGKK